MIFSHLRRRRAFPFFVFLLLGLLLLGAGLLSAQPATGTSSSAMLYIVGYDTIGVERIERTATALTGDLRLRGQPRMRWSQQLNEPAGVRTLRVDAWRPGAALTDEPMQRLVLQIRGDSAFVHAAPAAGAALGAPAASLAARRDASWIINQSLTHAAWLVQNSTSDTIWVVLSAGAQLLPAVVKRQGDSTTLTLAGMPSVYRFDSDGSLVEATVPSQQLRGVATRGAAGAAGAADRPTERVSYAAPAGAPYSAVDVTVPTPMGHTLAGTLTMPLGVTRAPAAVTITGSGGQDRDESIPGVEGYRLFRQVADTLGRRGIAVLRLDDRGVGASGGNLATATSHDFADDIRAAVAWLRQRSDIDPDRIALIGHSEGGLIAPLVAEKDPKLAGIALLAGPAYTGARIIEFQQRSAIDQLQPSATRAAKDSMFASAQQQLATMAQTNAWMREFLSYDPIPTAKRVRTPVLILQGETDQQVTAEQADSLAFAIRAGGNNSVIVHRLRDTNHLFQSDSLGTPARYGMLADRRVTSETLGLLADWLVNTLRVAR